MAQIPGWPTSLEREDFPTIVHALRFAAAQNPETIAVVCLGETMTYQELESAAASFSRHLIDQGIGTGDRVALIAKTSAKLPALIYGILGAGAHLTMMNPLFTPHEWRPLCDIARPKLAICDGDLRVPFDALSDEFGFEIIESGAIALGDDAADWHEDRLPNRDDPGVLLFTGGTTGVSKGVPHTHRQILCSLMAIEDRWHTVPAEEVFLNVPPLFHIVGLYHGVFQPAYGRATAIFMPRFDPEETFRLIEKYKVTVCIAGVPTAYTALLAHPKCRQTDFSSLKFAGGGGAPLSAENLREWQKVTGAPALEGYGMTEGAPTCTNGINIDRKPRSVGQPVFGIELEIVDTQTGTQEMGVGEPGEIRVQGYHVVSTYFNNQEATKAAFRDGWLYTGDIAYKDEDDYVFIVDRSKDMALVSGFNVFPREIDEVLVSHPGIKEAAAIGIPHPRKGEVIKAFVSLTEGTDLSAEDIITFCREQLVSYKIPAEVEFVTDLPKTPIGKIDKRHLGP